MQILGIEWKWNVPNALSVLRLLLVPLFMALYLLHLDMWAFGVLLLSGVTDILDGIIARRFNQITDCGKLVDPLADKVTQVAVVICLATRYSELLVLAIICFAKELCQGIGGLLLLRKGSTMRGSKWFGKASTVIFYACMLLIVLWSSAIPTPMLWGLVALATLSMLAAFIGYLNIFIKISATGKKVAQLSADPAEPKKG